MTLDEYRRAMDAVAPGPDLRGRIASALEKRPRRPSRGLLRAAAAVAAAALTLGALTGIAMAASEELREAVLRFFRIEEPLDPVGDAAALSEQAVEGLSVPGGVRAWFVELDFEGAYFPDYVRWEPGGGCAGFIRTRFDGETLRAYELAPSSRAFDVSWRGESYSGEIYYCVDNGELVTAAEGRSPGAGTSWYVNSIPGRTDAVLLYLERGSQSDYESYPLLLDLESGETEDFLVGLGADGLSYAYDYDFSPGLDAALVNCGSGRADGANTLWYLGHGGERINMDELAGAHIKWGCFSPSGEVILCSAGDSLRDYYRFDPASGLVRRVLSGVPALDGEATGFDVGTDKGVYVREDGSACVVDLVTGAAREIEGFRYEPGARFMANPSGTKFLYYSENWLSLGILDLESGRFAAFERAAPEGVSESVLSWYDDGRAMVLGSAGERVYVSLFELEG